MEQTRKANKVRDFAIGFFGWFLIGSLVMWIWEFILLVVTVIAIGILFFTKKNWFAYGIVAAVITNTLIFMLIFSLMGGFDWESMGLSLIYSLSAPFFMVGGYY